MNQDQALRKSLGGNSPTPPFGFDQRLMKRIVQVAEARSRRQYINSLILTAVVSLMMLGGTFYALNYFFSFNILHLFAGMALSASPLLVSCSCFSFLVLMLLVMDYMFRQYKAKAE